MEYNSISNQALGIIKDAGRNQVKHCLLTIYDKSMTSIMSSLKSDN